MMNDDEKALFRASLSDVTVLRQQNKANKQLANKKIALDREKESLRKAALGETQNNLEILKSLAPLKYQPQELVAFKTPGVQDGVYRKLKMGRYALEAKLDLHGFTVAEALKQNSRFIGDCYHKGARCVLISHGKGQMQAEPAKLKNHLLAWLEYMPEVLAFHSAQAKDGGAGSVYVLLKKNEQEKQENRERFSQLPKRD